MRKRLHKAAPFFVVYMAAAMRESRACGAGKNLHSRILPCYHYLEIILGDCNMMAYRE
jgi:hypothetical protein